MAHLENIGFYTGSFYPIIDFFRVFQQKYWLHKDSSVLTSITLKTFSTWISYRPAHYFSSIMGGEQL